MADKTNKVVRGYSLDPKNVEWVTVQAMAQSKPGKRVSDSLCLDNILTELRMKDRAVTRFNKTASQRVGAQA